MASCLEQLEQRKQKLDDELKEVEKQVYNLETSYLNDSSTHGNVLKGFEGFLTQHKATSLKRARNFKPEDRLFSLSSASSPANEECMQLDRMDDRTHTGRAIKRPN